MRTLTDIFFTIVTLGLGRRKTLEATLSLFTTIARELGEHIEESNVAVKAKKEQIENLKDEIFLAEELRAKAANALNKINSITGDGEVTVAELRSVA